MASEHLPLRLALERVAAELALFHRRSLALQDAASADGASGSLQDLDRMTQELEALSEFVEALSRHAPDSVPDCAPLLDVVRLGDIARRLAGAEAPAAASGDLDLF